MRYRVKVRKAARDAIVGVGAVWSSRLHRRLHSLRINSFHIVPVNKGKLHLEPSISAEMTLCILDQISCHIHP